MSNPRPLYKIFASSVQALKACQQKPVNEFGIEGNEEKGDRRRVYYFSVAGREAAAAYRRGIESGEII